LVYVPGESRDAEFSIDWMDSAGKTEPLLSVPGDYFAQRFSPDGRRLAVDIRERDQRDVWVYEWGRDTLSRLTFDPGRDTLPVWTPDGRRIAFASERAEKGTRNLYWQRADGTGDAERLTVSNNNQWPGSWHPTGKFLAFSEINRQRNAPDIMILPMEGREDSGWKPGNPTVFLNESFVENNPAFSPDGRWLAYMSRESGEFEVYVRPFPGPGGRWQVSTSGGNFPIWSRIRRELFYLAGDQRIMVAPYTVDGDRFRADKARLWSEGRLSTDGTFDLHPDGQHFAVVKAPEASDAKQDHVVLILNFFDYLRRIAPVQESR
jgi:serine/threonine-protein kinase